MNEIEIRPAALDDCAAIAGLMSQLGYPTSPAEMRERLSGILPDPNYVSLVAVRGGEVVGVIGAGLGRFYEKNGVYGRLLALAVREDRRGRGVGTALVAEAERRLADSGAATIVVNSGKHRVEAHRFYERLGYEATGVRFVKSHA